MGWIYQVDIVSPFLLQLPIYLSKLLRATVFPKSRVLISSFWQKAHRREHPLKNTVPDPLVPLMHGSSQKWRAALATLGNTPMRQKPCPLSLSLLRRSFADKCGTPASALSCFFLRLAALLHQTHHRRHTAPFSSGCPVGNEPIMIATGTQIRHCNIFRTHPGPDHDLPVGLPQVKVILPFFLSITNLSVSRSERAKNSLATGSSTS